MSLSVQVVPLFVCMLLRIYFLIRLPDAVILLVLMRSPMYFCRNLLWESSLSCSSFTASMRLNMFRSDSCRAWACLGAKSAYCLEFLDCVINHGQEAAMPH